MFPPKLRITVRQVIAWWLAVGFSWTAACGRDDRHADPSEERRAPAPECREPRPVCQRPEASRDFEFGQSGSLPYSPDAYPTLAASIRNFADRLTSADDRQRYQLLGELETGLGSEREAVLRAMAKDPNLGVRHQATVRLLIDGYKLSVEELAAGVDRRRPGAVDWMDPAARASALTRLREQLTCRCAAAIAGDAAQVLGVIGDASDVARLRELAAHQNPYVRLHAAFALVNLGATKDGTEILVGLTRSNEPYYAEQARKRLSRHPLGQ